jgi:RNA polymerase sigma factor (sigma-70 family)
MTAPPDFERIVQQFGPMIARIAASHEADQHRAEELVQDILLALWKALPSFRGEASLKTFVARVATNRSVSHVARAMGEPKPVALDEGAPSPNATPEDLVIDGDQRNKLITAMRTLPLAFRQPALLTLEGFTPVEIAELLGLTPNVVSIRITRAKERLRAALGEKP